MAVIIYNAQGNYVWPYILKFDKVKVLQQVELQLLMCLLEF